MTTKNPHPLWFSTRPRPPRWLLALIALVILLVAVPVGLHGLGDGSASTSSEADQPNLGAAGRSAAAGPSSNDAAGAGSAAAPSAANRSAVKTAPSLSPVEAPKISRNAWLGLVVTDLAAASARVRSVGSTAGGSVTSENLVTGGSPPSDLAPPQGSISGPAGPAPAQVDTSIVGKDQARLTLSVPAPKLDGVLAEIARIGTVSYRSSQAEDVTDAYVDTRARIEPARASVNRVQALLSEATDLKQVVLIESELSKRQADLDSLTQRLAGLDQRTTMSEVTVTLWTDASRPAASDSGFLDGLRTARDGLLRSVAVITVGLATMAPWLFVLAPLGWVVVRVQRRRHPAVTPSTSPPSASTPTPVPAQHTE